jgi:hypothetical protein
MKRWALSVALCLCASTAFGQQDSPVEGVWQVAEWLFPSTNPSEKGRTVTSPEPGLVIFTGGFFSQLVVRGEQPRAAVAPLKDRQNPTDAEKIALYEHWRPLTANGGTYEVKGSTLILRPMVAKNLAVSAQETPVQVTFKFDGPNTLWLIPTPQSAAREPQTKYIRLE